MVKDRTTDINTYLSENLSGIKITQVFNQEERKMADFLRRSNDLKKAKQNQIFVFGIFRPMVYMLYISSVLCLLYLGGRGYIKGGTFLGQSFTSGVIVSFYMYVNKFFNPIQNLAEQFNQLQSAFASAEKIFTIFDMKPEVVVNSASFSAAASTSRPRASMRVSTAAPLATLCIPGFC